MNGPVISLSAETQRERERERDRQTDRQTERERQRERERVTNLSFQAKNIPMAVDMTSVRTNMR